MENVAEQTRPTILRGAKRLQVAYYKKRLGPWESAIPKWEDLTSEQRNEFIAVATALNEAESTHGADVESVVKEAAKAIQHLKPEHADMAQFERYLALRYAEYANHFLDRAQT